MQRTLSEGDVTAEKESVEREHYSERRIPGESTRERLDEADPIDAFTRNDSIMAERIRQLSQQLLDKTEAEIESKEDSSSQDTEYSDAIYRGGGGAKKIPKFPRLEEVPETDNEVEPKLTFTIPPEISMIPLRYDTIGTVNAVRTPPEPGE
ncbi:hypothetical protein QAD02_007504 [Eretmocerus hayati]|uniref:Uncharacterized protein n=1 Tax=Eretmocerus hayati TaxID=131215 RepID=A0ACC2N472_9HYME|nr:hypothetical protein QAD02_007504 [Eretmocerus hayati]